MKKILFIIAVTLVIGGVFLVISKKNSIENAPTAQPQKIEVEVISTKEGEMKQMDRFLAEVYADRSVDFSTKVSAFVLDVSKEGSVVKKGDTILRLDARELENSIGSMHESKKALTKAIESQSATLMAQESELDFIKKRSGRDRRLFEIGAISKEQLERAELDEDQIVSKVKATSSLLESKESELRSLEKSIKSKEEELKYFNIKAPIDGIVDRVYVQTGEMSAPFKTLLTIVGNNRAVRFSTPLDFSLNIGSAVTSKEFNGTVTTIYESTKGHLKECEATIEGRAKVGELASIYVEGATHRGFILPCRAILHKESSYLYVFKNGRFQKESINLLAQDGDICLIDKHLDAVALAHPSTLLKLSTYDNVEIAQ